ncbi:MAG: hypothetical protein K2O32_13135 [Acetatifactor sp.]|nr:hypothetical protein [Acetatifactor sp.]
MFFIWIFLVAAFLIALLVFVIASIILFIKDGIRAKREETGRKTYIIAMFSISMAIIALVVVGWILFYILGILFMRSM